MREEKKNDCDDNEKKDAESGRSLLTDPSQPVRRWRGSGASLTAHVPHPSPLTD